MRDSPFTALEKAVFWIEYVIRYHGAPHLRSAVQDLAWYQYYLLDVIVFLSATAATFACIFFKLSRLVFKNIRGKSKKTDKTMRRKAKKED